MTRLLLYACCTGQPSSRQIERATCGSPPYRYLAANQHPDHDTLAAFRRRHLTALARLGHVAPDGTKVRANASTHRSVSHGRLREARQRWQQVVNELLAGAEQADRAQDAAAAGACRSCSSVARRPTARRRSRPRVAARLARLRRRVGCQR